MSSPIVEHHFRIVSHVTDLYILFNNNKAYLEVI